MVRDPDQTIDDVLAFLSATSRHRIDPLIEKKMREEGMFEEWTDPHSGYLCRIRRINVGAWCGYVRVPKGHPAYGKHYDSVGEDVEVHGGLSYGDEVFPDNSDIEESEYYWLGFDCAHADDYIPGLTTQFESNVYRDKEYVKNECTWLAKQLLKKMRNDG